jgi:hypothetical protein
MLIVCKIITKRKRNPFNGLYKLDLNMLKIYMCVVDEFMELEVWHQRLGHVNFEHKMSLTRRA